MKNKEVNVYAQHGSPYVWLVAYTSTCDCSTNNYFHPTQPYHGTAGSVLE